MFRGIMLTRTSGMRLGRTGFGLLVGALGAQACSGESDRPPDVHVSSGGSGARTGSGGASGTSAGEDGEGGMQPGTGGTSGAGGTAGTVSDPGAPKVEITSPESVAGPNDDGVLLEKEIDVLCTVKPASKGANPVAPESVYIEILDQEGSPIPLDEAGGITTIATTPTENDDEYLARLVLNNLVENGPVGFRCRGSDTSDPPLTGTDSIETFLDLGPKITLDEPQANSAHALIGALDVTFRVDEAPLADDDEGAAIEQVTLEVGGVDFTDSLSEEGGEYSTSVDLTDTALFPTTPFGEFPVAVRAVNLRGGESVLNYTFLVDGQGPQIEIVSPAGTMDPIVGGRVPLIFRITDPLSGVNENAVVVEVNKVDNLFGEGGEWSRAGDTYTYEFDTTQIEGSKWQVTVVVRATDLAGNESVGEQLLLWLDNVPPIVDLDPPNVRTWRKYDATTNHCSVSFDPVGEVIDDLGQATRSAFLRAVVWDRTNDFDQLAYKFAGTREDSVRLYVQPDPEGTFLVNNPGDPDPDCDDLDEATRNDLTFIELTAIPPTGAAFFGDGDETAVPPIASIDDVVCVEGADTTPPTKLCANEKSDMTTVIAHTSTYQHTTIRPPVIYGYRPDFGGEACTGIDWELGANADEGWVCLAARALDAVGNIGISRPLRICYDDPLTAFVPACKSDDEPPPSCTDGCVLPPAFEGGAVKQ
jgi:hypothetical protein